VTPIALMYHDVVPAGRQDASGFPGGDAARYKLTIARFDAHLRAIRAAVAAPPCLTFDDGGASARTVAERLEAFGWRGHFFVTAAYVDHPGFLTRAELCDLFARGHIIGSHSYSHPLRMGRWPQPRVAEEWQRSVDVLAGMLGAPITTASVPGGHYARRVAEAAAKAGIRTLFTSRPTARAVHVGPVLVLGRFVVQRSTPPETAARAAAGALMPRLRQRALWDIKKAGKAIAGGAYLAIRGRLLRRSDRVRWGDELPRASARSQ
jgi:peptidoglycan/xylan/chitin deacetylase (PgdA/CDA1 family)